jgi:hypothetical protein
VAGLTEIAAVTPTPLLRRQGGRLRQTARVTVRYGGTATTGVFRGYAERAEVVTPVALAPGESVLDIELPEVTATGPVALTLQVDGLAAAHWTGEWTQPRHWVVHVVQLSHHDVGYTDLASHVVAEHDRWLDATIEMAEATRDYPDEARFRAVIEQAWSIDHYLRHASPSRASAILELLRGGQLELTALFGNMVTELCGHETLIRSVYPAFRLQRDHGIPIVSAEHNDIPGFSWGLSQVLTEAGIRIFCPGLPKYYHWGNPGAPSFWDEAALFGADGRPGAFWWQAPSGRRVLLWCNNQGCGGGCDPRLPGLAERLQQLHETGYPYSVLRWPVNGGARDNSPYIDGYARAIRQWNENWAWPRLVCSTNARFHRDLLPQLPATLPVFRGELPGQDYTVGAMSTAAATAANRRNHADLPAAETLAAAAVLLATAPHAFRAPPMATPAATTLAGAAAALPDGADPCAPPAAETPPELAERPHHLADVVDRAYREVLWHDEHTWGHHFPAGPTAAAAELEKAAHAFRAAALAHDVASKAMASMADAVALDPPGIHLVVFNPLPNARSGLVTTPLREFDNCGSIMAPTDRGTLRGVLLGNRWHLNPPPAIVNGLFDLIDVATGEAVPYQIDILDSPLGPQPHASQRMGLGAGSQRYGFFEQPAGIARDLVFHADAVPPLGYRTYCLRSRADRPAFAVGAHGSGGAVESPFYRLEIDPETGCVRSLYDKESGREWVDPAGAHPFGAILVRDPRNRTEQAVLQRLLPARSGPLTAAARVVFAGHGHPRIEVTYTLCAREKRVDVAIALLKDPEPLLEAYVAFPFRLPAGRFRYEGPLAVVDPERDLLPGAYCDRLSIQNWVCASDGAQSLLWSSLDAPVVSLARLWPGRVSPAHSAVVRADLVHAPQTVGQGRGGAIYSLLAANNFGTNFAVSQCGGLLCRYCLTTISGNVDDGAAASAGRQFQTPLQTLFTEHPGPRPLPTVGSVLTLAPDGVQLLTLKPAEDGCGWIARLWNPSDGAVTAQLALPRTQVVAACLADLAEGAAGDALAVTGQEVSVPLTPRSVVTVRLATASTPSRGGCQP